MQYCPEALNIPVVWKEVRSRVLRARKVAVKGDKPKIPTYASDNVEEEKASEFYRAVLASFFLPWVWDSREMTRAGWRQ